MIPSKLYIPTTTLNFNNIMASESISPAGFYSVRGFGYKRFDKVEPNNLDYRIILYDKFPVFSINDKEFENYPLVIEIDTKTIGEDIIQEYKNGVYYSEETIYFNPFSTQFIFNNEIEKRSTLSKVEQSLNTKMVAIYQNNIILKTPNIDSFEWENTDLLDSKNDFSKHISKDRKTNKLKGFLYAYLLGANKSLPSEIVALKKYAKELENVLSAIITSLDNRATYQQEEQLKKLYQSINNAFFRADEKFKSIIKQKIEQYKCENFIDILRFEGLCDYWCQKQNIKPLFQITQFYISPSSLPDEKQIAFDNYIANLTNAINKIAAPRNIKVDDLPILQHNSRVENVQENSFLPKLFNEYLTENWNNEEFVSSRLEFATTGGKLFKEELHDKWENSPSKNYINDLRNNLASHTTFSLQSTDNLTLKSFAAFCQKGEENIDKLEDYLISNGIGDFRIAFALWGIIFGFANTPKTLTNDLFLSSDLNYVSEAYKYIYKQIHGIDLEGKLERKLEKEFVTVPSKINEQLKNEEKKETNIKQQKEDIENEYREKLKQVPKITNPQIDSIIEVLKSNQFLINDNLFDEISKIDKLGKRTNLFKAVKECLQPNQQKTVYQHNPTLEFDFPPQKEFYLDDNAWSYIERLTYKNQKIKEKVKKNLKTIQEGYRPNGYYDKRGDSKDNKKVIDHFLVWNVSDKNQYCKLLQGDFPDEIREEIRKILESKYPN